MTEFEAAWKHAEMSVTLALKLNEHLKFERVNKFKIAFFINALPHRNRIWIVHHKLF